MVSIKINCSKVEMLRTYIVGSPGVVVLVLWLLGSVGDQCGYNGVQVPLAEEFGIINLKEVVITIRMVVYIGV